MFSITREQFIEAGLVETERLRTLAKQGTTDREQMDWWMTRIANVQFAIEHLTATDPGHISFMAPSEMRALMEILYG